MASEPKPHCTPEQYFDLDSQADFKSEYFRGEMWAMAGGTFRHAQIVKNLVRELSNKLRGGGCDVFFDVRLAISFTGLYTYPDAMVVCGEPEAYNGRNDTLTNPVVVFEVLSESTVNYDRGEKSEHFRRLPSLQEYVILAQDRTFIEHHVRQSSSDGWLLIEHLTPGGLELSSIDTAIGIADLYERIRLDA